MIELKALQGQVKNLVEDLRMQVAAKDDLRAELRHEYADAKSADRVGVTFETWLDDVLDQAAVAWVLGCVFVRFCEDNRLVDRLWIGGPEEDASTERAMQAMQGYIIANPRDNDRHWLRQAFAHLQNLRATSKIFDKHNPVWRFDISAGAAEALSAFFRRGAGFRSLRSEHMDTRFLGDLYQDLSIHAQKKYALLQTPEFVEEFILDRTFTPALKEFGLAAMSVIDPTCGSGHFLLGAFNRLLGLWKEREPATAVDTLVERALGQVTGVDLNPFAVAIARFRLMIAALRATGRTNLNNSYSVRVATGDSLLHWGQESGSHQGDLLASLDGRPEFAYYSEDGDLLAEYLRNGSYTVVVGNPPYITVKDSKLNERYREEYPTVCYRQYALTAPFAQRFFELAKRADADGHGAGVVGQITANSFMKREFGKKLINDFFAHEVELIEVIDTSGAHIPGHGTPTAILVGKNRLVSPRYSGSIRTAFGIQGEPSVPTDAARGLVWTAIVNQIDGGVPESEWISVADVQRARLATHPWSLSGGGSGDLVAFIEQDRPKLGSRIQSVGRTTSTGADDAYFLPDLQTARRLGDESQVRDLVVGEQVRDFRFGKMIQVRNPYADIENRIPVEEENFLVARNLWQYRSLLADRVIFGKTITENGHHWYEHLENYSRKLKSRLGIAFSFVATHNHFTLDRRGRLFNRSAPVVKLSKNSDEDSHLELLGLLNSSTACFWLKQVNQDKGNRGGERSTGRYAWESYYEFSGAKLQEFPLPSEYPLELAKRIQKLADRDDSTSLDHVFSSASPSREIINKARTENNRTRSLMIAAQEELDWAVYRLYGLVEEDLTSPNSPPLNLGERAFEIAMARKLELDESDVQWFIRHGSTPIADLPGHWPADYKELVEKRITMIESDQNIGLIERPECKRRWATGGWYAMQDVALREWLLDRLEASELWGGSPTPLSVAQLADRVRHVEDFRSVLDLWVGTDQHDLVKTLGKLIADEHVPFLPTDRYKPAGMRKRAQWERTWALQRREDAGEKVEIDVPPKYTSGDFKKASYWRNRGKLDVPKERFISYPRMGRDGDSTELLGWAGWDHLAQARALASVYLDRKTQGGWPPERLLPMLAGLAELEPWLRQWHSESAPGFPSSPAEFFTGLIDTELAGLGEDRHTLTVLRGVEELA
ncbi:BREX-2 system adenine-specific DNA-methyltransferase PglX [Nocardia pseudobrasiliensis]|uniref:site-specific DNA-methyltransferase (adenine-specific) n=1 Tax=Nocardia pseudobrasiliensis TaxID=45979 RepID=A0A370HTI7_9NOCA|nr:BREX-2 system adenine-specific DNA-methyltransferase PglX [Nocardia pseudobrasiliensis]RDI60274.1 hypothetical protein DFR76_1166 [Nocardia pseudobrasiliensis]